MIRSEHRPASGCGRGLLTQPQPGAGRDAGAMACSRCTYRTQFGSGAFFDLGEDV